MMNIYNFIRQNLLNIPGWRTNRHIVVIESDDWGSIRMPSKDVYNKLIQHGIKVDNCHYCSNDSIATEDDLSFLFEILNSVRDKNRHPAVFTANAVVANPDFDKIRESGFESYHYKLITDYIPHLKGCENSITLWKEGQKKDFFILQSHGREHLNVARWMHYLQQNFQETRFAFDLGVFGISTTITAEKRKSFLPAFDFETKDEELSANTVAKDGLILFEKLFGYKSESFIAPNYKWGKSLETTIHDFGVRYIQGQQRAIYRNAAGEQNKKRIRRMGGRSEPGLMDLCRNCVFEPSSYRNKDWVDSCLHDMANAFFWKHPAIICSHRVNYISSIDIKNRDNGLKQLSQLLNKIVQLWPDVEFMSSNQLGKIISEENGAY